MTLRECSGNIPDRSGYGLPEWRREWT